MKLVSKLIFTLSYISVMFWLLYPSDSYLLGLIALILVVAFNRQLKQTTIIGDFEEYLRKYFEIS